MITLTDQMTVGEIAARIPASARIFESHGIDFCCGGKVKLSAACERKGLSADSLLQDIERSTTPAGAPPVDWASAPLNNLIDHILDKHHGYLKTELPHLEAVIEKVVQKHGGKYGDMPARLRPVFGTLKDELQSHLMKEEMVLFPLIRTLELNQGADAPAFHCGSVRNPIRVMEHEHDSAGEALAEMRRITGDYAVPEDACNTFRALYHQLQEMERDLHQHIHLENNVLFPRAAELE